MDGKRLQRWWNRVTERNWGGLHFQHAALCARRAWLFSHGLRSVNEHMQTATQAHDSAYSRDRSTAGLLGLYPDRILWSERTVEEHKTKRAHQDCARAQALFYAGGLTAATGHPWLARVVDLSTRRKEDFLFTDQTLSWMERLAEQLEPHAIAPAAVKISACKSCSFNSLCLQGQEHHADMEL